jgi:MarR family transcriptional regulator, organic hydroperoxide resistance regulator
MSTLPRPTWWSYPAHCQVGHPWAPGLVIVGWMPCDCPAALREPGHGHLWVRCRAAGCREIWYRPEHTPLGAPGPAREAAGPARSQPGQAGLLTRRRDERDNRLVRLWLTEAGRALQQPVEAERRRIEELVTADLPAAEREQLLTRWPRSAARRPAC